MSPISDRSRLWLAVLFAPFVALAFAIEKLFDLSLIGQYLARGDDRKLESEVRENFSFLFTEKNARFVREDRKPKRVFDLAVATVAAEDLFFYFVRMRGDFAASVTSRHQPHGWRELNDVLEEADVEECLSVSGIVDSRRSRFFTNPEDASRVLRDRWDQLTRHYKLQSGDQVSRGVKAEPSSAPSASRR